MSGWKRIIWQMVNKWFNGCQRLGPRSHRESKLEYPVNSKCKEYGIENIESHNLEPNLFFINSPHPYANEEPCDDKYWSIRKKSHEWHKWALESNESSEEKGDGAIKLKNRLKHSVRKYSEAGMCVNYLEGIFSIATTWTIKIVNMANLWNKIVSTIPPGYAACKSLQCYPTSAHSTKSLYGYYRIATA